MVRRRWTHVSIANQKQLDKPIGPVLTKANKYVLTRGSAKLDWANRHRMRNIEDLRKVKAGEGPDIVLWGSSTLYPQLLEANLIDRFLLLTTPVVSFALWLVGLLLAWRVGQPD
jgi:dihydrofolate reductase